MIKWTLSNWEKYQEKKNVCLRENEYNTKNYIDIFRHDVTFLSKTSLFNIPYCLPFLIPSDLFPTVYTLLFVNTGPR